MENPLSNESENPQGGMSAPKQADALQSRPAIRTLQSDVASSVRDNNISITKIALAQQERNASLPFVSEEKTRFWSAWSIGTIVLVLAGFGVIAAAAVIVMSKSISLPFVNQEPLAPTLVPVLGRQTIDVDRMPRAELIQTINGFADSDYASPVALEALILQETVTATSPEGETVTSIVPLSLETFFERIGARAPDRLLRSIGPDMTLGRAGATPFIVVTTSSYEMTFADMLAWEPLMAEDLPFIAKKPDPIVQQPILPIEPVIIAPTSTTTVSTTTTTEATSTATSSTDVSASSTLPVSAPIPLPKLPSVLTWKDIIIKNKDVRALVTDDGEIHLLYAFPKDGLVVITQTKEAFTLVVDAINAPVYGM